MPSFGKTSKKRLSTAHPDLQTLFGEVIKHFDCSIVCGHRTEEDQEAVYQAKLSKVRWPESKHNALPSMAVDAAPYDNDIHGIDWQDENRFYFFAGFVVATAKRLFDEGKIRHGIRWGGDWDGDTKTNDQKFMDLPHFELISIKDM